MYKGYTGKCIKGKELHEGRSCIKGIKGIRVSKGVV